MPTHPFFRWVSSLSHFILSPIVFCQVFSVIKKDPIPKRYRISKNQFQMALRYYIYITATTRLFFRLPVGLLPHPARCFTVHAHAHHAVQMLPPYATTPRLLHCHCLSRTNSSVANACCTSSSTAIRKRPHPPLHRYTAHWQ